MTDAMTEQEFRAKYPPEVIELMLQRQKEQGNPRSIEPFLKGLDVGKNEKGFDWENTPEGYAFWSTTLYYNIDVFYKRYPKINNILLIL